MSTMQIDPKPLREIRTEEPTKFVVFFPDGHHIIQVSPDGAIQLRISDGQRVGSFMSMPDVNACAVSKDGERFVAAHDYRVTVWNLATQSKACEYDCSQVSCVSGTRRTQAPYFTALDISPDSSRVAIGDSTGSIVMLNISNGGLLATCRFGHDLYLDSLRFSPDGVYLAVGTTGKISDGHVTTPSTLHILDISTASQMTRCLEVPFGSFTKDVSQHERPIVVDWRKGAQQVLVGSHRSLVVVDVMTRSVERKDIPSFQTLSNDGNFVLSTGAPGQLSPGVYFWDPVMFTEMIFSIPQHLPLAVSFDSTLLATIPLNDDSDYSYAIVIWTIY